MVRQVRPKDNQIILLEYVRMGDNDHDNDDDNDKKRKTKLVIPRARASRWGAVLLMVVVVMVLTMAGRGHKRRELRSLRKNRGQLQRQIAERSATIRSTTILLQTQTNVLRDHRQNVESQSQAYQQLKDQLATLARSLALARKRKDELTAELAHPSGNATDDALQTSLQRADEQIASQTAQMEQLRRGLETQEAALARERGILAKQQGQIQDYVATLRQAQTEQRAARQQWKGGNKQSVSPSHDDDDTPAADVSETIAAALDVAAGWVGDVTKPVLGQDTVDSAWQAVDGALDRVGDWADRGVQSLNSAAQQLYHLTGTNDDDDRYDNDDDDASPSTSPAGSSPTA